MYKKQHQSVIKATVESSEGNVERVGNRNCIGYDLTWLYVYTFVQMLVIM